MLTDNCSTARPPKVDSLKAKYGGKVDVVGIADIANGDYSEALKGSWFCWNRFYGHWF